MKSLRVSTRLEGMTGSSTTLMVSGMDIDEEKIKSSANFWKKNI